MRKFIIRGLDYFVAGFCIATGSRLIMNGPWLKLGRGAEPLFYVASSVMFAIALCYIKKIFTESEQREKS